MAYDRIDEAVKRYNEITSDLGVALIAENLEETRSMKTTVAHTFISLVDVHDKLDNLPDQIADILRTGSSYTVPLPIYRCH